MMKRLVLFAAAVVLTASTGSGLLGVFLKNASALPQAQLGNYLTLADNSYPQPPSGEHVLFMRKQGQFTGIQQNVQLDAYYPPAVTQWGQLYLRIVPGANPGIKNVCYAVTTGMTSGLYQFVSVTLTSLGPGGGGQGSVTYNIPADNVCTQNSTRQNKDTSYTVTQQHNNVFYANYQLPPKPTGVDNITGDYVVRMNIQYNSAVPNDPDQGIRFRVVGPGDSTVPFNNNVVLGQEGGGSKNFSILGDWTYADPNSSFSGPTRIAVPFGQCVADASGLPTDDTSGGVVSIYDADNPGNNTGGPYSGPFGGMTVSFRVKDNDYDAVNNPTPGVDSNGYVLFKNPTANGSGSGQGTLSPDNTTYTPPAGPASVAGRASVTMRHFVAADHYQLEVSGIAIKNTLALGIPGDAVYGYLNCKNIKLPKIDCESLALTPAIVQPGDSVAANLTATTSGYGGSPPDPLKAAVSVNGGADKVGSLSSVSAGRYKGTVPLGSYPAGIYGVRAIVSNPANPAQRGICSSSFTVLNDPYVSVYGGDAEAGVSPLYDGSSYSAYTNPDPTKKGGFVSWNDGDATGWGSAGAQWAVQALGNIIGFASGRGLAAKTTVPQYLSFTNTSSVSGNKYGGFFDGKGNVKTDYTSDIQQASVVYNGNQTLPGGLVGTQTVVVKNGDAYIQGPIKYSTTTWATPKDIPAYKLIVVGGNIYIDQSVNELDGTYVAIPKVSGGVTTGGNIYTCSQAPFTQIDSNTDNYYGLCQIKLQVFGALVAKKVNFDRTGGNYTNQAERYNTTGAAEAIIYGPEMWLSSTPGGSSNYSAITGLPPIL